MNSTQKALAERYAQFSNDQLLEIREHKDEYTPEAIAVLQAEIDKRNLSKAELDRFEENKKQRQEAAARNASTPLTFTEKVFYFFAWFAPGFIGKALGMNYREDGLLTKISQSRFYRVAGFVSLFIIAFAGMNWDLSGVASVAVLVAFAGMAYVIDVMIFFKR